MTDTLAHWYSSESTEKELSNEYQHDRVKNLCIIVLWMKVASALEGLMLGEGVGGGGGGGGVPGTGEKNIHDSSQIDR